MAGAATEQLEWEARWSRIAAGAAALSLLLFVAGSVYGLTAVERRQPRTVGDLALISRNPVDFVVPAVIAALAFALLAVVLAYLYRVTKARRSQLPAAALGLLVFGALATAVTLVAQRIDIVNAAQAYRTAGTDASGPVRDELRGRVPLQVILGFNLGGYLALGLSTVLVSIGAMRAGIFSRFLGIIGVVAALSLLLPLLPLQIIFMFWLGALAALFLDRWPGGRGPAWASAEATPWPSMSQRNAELDRRGAEDDVGDATGAEEQDDGPPAAAQAGSPSRSKRKRGRRR